MSSNTHHKKILINYTKKNFCSDKTIRNILIRQDKGWEKKNILKAIKSTSYNSKVSFMREGIFLSSY